jgi:hypothetical protein
LAAGHCLALDSVHKMAVTTVSGFEGKFLAGKQ